MCQSRYKAQKHLCVPQNETKIPPDGCQDKLTEEMSRAPSLPLGPTLPWNFMFLRHSSVGCSKSRSSKPDAVAALAGAKGMTSTIHKIHITNVKETPVQKTMTNTSTWSVLNRRQEFWNFFYSIDDNVLLSVCSVFQNSPP